MEFWDSKLSGKKKLALDSRILVYNQFDEDYYFAFTFCIGYTTIQIIQVGEDKYEVLFDGIRFYDIMAEEKMEKKYKQKKIEKEKKIIAEQIKKDQEYYKRDLK